MKINEKNMVAFATSATPVDREGWLNKRGEVNRGYQRRWFVLKGNILFYFNRRGDKEPVGMIVLEGSTIELAEDEEQFGFKIVFHGPNNRSYALAAESQESMEQWMKALSCASYDYMRLMVAELQRQLDAAAEEVEPLNSPPVYREGWLNKSNEVNCRYQRRWFVLKGNILFYFNRRGDKEPVGMIVLEGSTVELAEDEEQFGFKIIFHGPSNRSYVFTAESQESMEQWMKGLSRACYDYMRLMEAKFLRQLDAAAEEVEPLTSLSIYREGWLNKRDEVNRVYQRRWFVLKGNILFYFNQRGDKEPIGMIVLEGSTIELAKDEEQFGFKIVFHGSNNRNYALAAESQESMEQWMKTLSCASYDYRRLIVAELQRQLDVAGEEVVSLNSPPMYREGWLNKRDEINRGYQRRWFVLKGNILFYFNQHGEKEPVGMIGFEGSTIELAEDEEQFGFTIVFHGPNSRSYVFTAESQESMEQWMKAIGRACYDYMRLAEAELQRQLNAAEEEVELLTPPPQSPKAPPRQRHNPFNKPESHHRSQSVRSAPGRTENVPRTRITFRDLHTIYGRRILEDLNAWRHAKKNAEAPLITL